jgi:fructokinase
LSGARKRVVGLGEVLWDLLHERTSLGGAPANFAYIATLLGDQGIVASRVGEDQRGSEALQEMRERGLDIGHAQKDQLHATGTVKVELDANGQPRYEIAEPVAWDFLEWTSDWQMLAESADAVCFGTLAQRSEASRATIRKFLAAASISTVKVFDVNLRQAFYSRETLVESMTQADIVKLNDEELPKVMNLSGLPHEDELSSAQRLVRDYDLKMVCVTRGGHGSLLVRAKEVSEHAGFKVRVADTVGAGDAFTAGLVHEYLRGASLERCGDIANRAGAWVASQVGGMPRPKQGALEDSLAEIH